jgi:hypothetical protein
LADEDLLAEEDLLVNTHWRQTYGTHLMALSHRTPLRSRKARRSISPSGPPVGIFGETTAETQGANALVQRRIDRTTDRRVDAAPYRTQPGRQRPKSTAWDIAWDMASASLIGADASNGANEHRRTSTPSTCSTSISGRRGTASGATRSTIRQSLAETRVGKPEISPTPRTSRSP